MSELTQRHAFGIWTDFTSDVTESITLKSVRNATRFWRTALLFLQWPFSIAQCQALLQNANKYKDFGVMKKLVRGFHCWLYWQNVGRMKLLSSSGETTEIRLPTFEESHVVYQTIDHTATMNMAVLCRTFYRWTADRAKTEEIAEVNGSVASLYFADCRI